jgi:hypothetical protein
VAYAFDPNPYNDAWTTESGTLVASEPAAPPTATRLRAPYPNPAQGAVTVAFDLAEPAAVRLTLFDALGREVSVLAESDYPAGRHRVVVDREAFPAGVYFVYLRAGRHRHVQAVTIVR